MLQPTFGQRLPVLRKSAGYSQREFAEEIGKDTRRPTRAAAELTPTLRLGA
jgi:transcriptional regulator with XRE-family HTH domain